MRSSFLLLLSVIFFLASATLIHAQPNTPSTYNAKGNHLSSSNPCSDINIQGWQDVPASRITLDPNFDESVPADYASVWTGLDSLNKYPNGFRKGQVYENNDPPFCFNVYNVASKQVQVMIQAVDEQARLCIMDASRTGVRMSGGIDRCFTDKHTACFGGETYANTLTLVVYSDSTASTTATPFWYRVRTSGVTWDLAGADAANSAIKTLEMWCMMMDQDPVMMRYPRELRSEVKPDNIKVRLTMGNAAAAQQGSVIAVLLLAIATMLAVVRQ